MTTFYDTDERNAIAEDLGALRSLTRDIARRVANAYGATGGGIHTDMPAGAIARSLWQALGRRRALVVATKIERIASADGGTVRRPVRRARPAHAANGNGHRVAVIDHLAEQAPLGHGD